MARVMQTTYRGSVSLIVPRRLTLASVVIRYRRRRTRTPRTAMLSAVILLTIVCAITGQNVNETKLTEKILKRITPLADTATKTLELINPLGVDKNLVEKITTTAKTAAKLADDFSYIANVDSARGGENPVLKSIEESPDYASSVVLASDLLSLTTAVANVKERACREQGYKFLDGLLQNKRWALKMFDASAKSPQGLLFGSSYHLGNFDECIAIDDRGEKGGIVEGEYCLATIKWRRGEEAKKERFGRGETLRWAVCVPSSCSARAVSRFVGDVLTHTVGNGTAVIVTERDCYARRPISVDTMDISYLSFMMGFIALLILCSVYEIYTIALGKEKRTVTHELIVSFSLINNIKKIISTKQNNDLGLECISGIKSLAMIFIVAGHACMFIGSGPVMDAEAWDRLIRHPANSFMLSNTLLVDTFLMLSAFLFCRLLLIEFDKRRGKLNVIPILIFRYIRVTPAYAVVILFYMTWLPKIGEGPLWKNRMVLEQERCLSSWWANILYINNYIQTDEICMFQSWYLSVDTQLFFVAPIFIYSLWRWRRIGSVFLALATFISLAIPSYITYRDQLDPTLLFYAKEFTDFATNFYFKVAYIKTHMKMTPYFMGLITGYILHRIQSENYKMSRLMKIFGWLTSIVLGTVAVFSVSVFYQEWYKYNKIEAAAYVSLHKLAWSIANGWLIIACCTGNGGILNKLLTWKVFVPISRLTFCAYLVNGIVELYYVSQLRHPLHVTFFTMVANSIAHLVLTFNLAVILCVIFESPIHGIERILLRIFARPALSDNARRDMSAESSRNTSQSKLET
ncbi:PREDICTED: nose resistant to fluoxetine protein 6-like [Papilio xuthus]|uniref:Nose resistant to fluoxetine protein 6-like n=1 Tax=Papilio xuthus TaxID=66420 RepID=A0AAJ6YZ37_PAPXU|nr:PREDICTED: nose resistant to fluoxetine protein 6-like [Papilio xuthus]